MFIPTCNSTLFIIYVVLYRKENYSFFCDSLSDYIQTRKAPEAHNFRGLFNLILSRGREIII